MALRILIADDHAIVRRGLRDLIEHHIGWEVCAEASDCEGAIRFGLQERPDIAVLDVAMPGLGGLAVAIRFRELLPDTRVLMFSMHDEDETVRASLVAGARVYLLKTDAERHLEAAILALQGRRAYFSPAIAELVMLDAFNTGNGRRERIARLTPREIEIVQHIADGMGNREIAAALNVSVKTIETHRAAVMRKIGARSAGEVVRFAIKHSLVRI